MPMPTAIRKTPTGAAASPATKTLDQCQSRDLVRVTGIRTHNSGFAWALVGNDGAVLVLTGADALCAFVPAVIESEVLLEPDVGWYGQSYILAEAGNRYTPSDPIQGITVLSELNGKMTLFIRCELWWYEKEEPGKPPPITYTRSESYYNVSTGEFLPKSSIGTPRETFSGWRLSFNSGEFELNSDKPPPQ